MTLAALANERLPAGDHFDGRSYCPQLLGGAGSPRDWIFAHYDKDPSLADVPFSRVRFARTKRFKLYSDGRFYDVPHDWEERRPIPQESTPQEASTIRAKLLGVLHSMPAWNPQEVGTATPRSAVR